MASDKRHGKRADARDDDDPVTLRERVVEKVADRMAVTAAKQQKAAAHLAHHAEALDRATERLHALDVWLRAGPTTRKPRFTRDDIAAAAMQIADADGFDAVSMRRIAAELDAGTMTLYHYVRTKDELLSLVVDAVMGELLLPDDEMRAADW